MYTEAYRTYVRLLEELNELFAKNLGNSTAAEKVRNLTDELWPQLSETEREEINKDVKLPSDLFWLEVEEKLRGWKFSNPSDTLKEIHPYNTDKNPERSY